MDGIWDERPEWSVNERLIGEGRVGRLGFPIVEQIK